jgi:hypothetical protein
MKFSVVLNQLLLGKRDCRENRLTGGHTSLAPCVNFCSYFPHFLTDMVEIRYRTPVWCRRIMYWPTVNCKSIGVVKGFFYLRVQISFYQWFPHLISDWLCPFNAEYCDRQLSAEEPRVTSVMGLSASSQCKTPCRVRWVFVVKYCDYCLVLETDGGNIGHSGSQQGGPTAARSQVGFRNQASESMYALWRPWTGEHILAMTDENIFDLDGLDRFPCMWAKLAEKAVQAYLNLESLSLHLSLSTGTYLLGVRFTPCNKPKSNLCAFLAKYNTK